MVHELSSEMYSATNLRIRETSLAMALTAVRSASADEYATKIE